MIKKILITITVFALFAFKVQADDSVKFLIQDGNLNIETSTKIKHSVFKRFNDLWLVFSKKDLKLALNKKDLENFGVLDFEKIIVKNGSGYRLRLNKDFKVATSQNYETQQSLIIVGENLKEFKVNTIKFRIKNMKNKVKELFLDNTFILDYAYSYQTGEKYVVAISNDTRLSYPSMIFNEDIRFLPTYSGMVAISENGEFLNIIDEDKLQLADKEDEFFAKSDKNISSSVLKDFFKKTGIELLEKQRRDYSQIYDDSKNYKTKNDIETAINNIDTALELVNKLDHLKQEEKPSQINQVGLALVNIEESEVEDMSGLGDDLIEGTKKTELEKKQVIYTDGVLVPDLSGVNLNELLQSQRLESIKKASLTEKEKVIIKRMQVQAFRQYFYEVIGLSKLVKLDISGEFPKNNKALALYALASSLTKRCNNITDLPEDYDDIYTRDIRLWKAVCLVKNKKFASAEVIFRQENKRIKSYPDYLRSVLTNHYAIALQGLDKYQESTELLQESKKHTQDLKVKDEIEFNIGLNYLYSNESKVAESVFKSLVNSNNDLVKYKARLEYLNLLLYKDDVKRDVITKALEDLRFEFRDNLIELEATKLLASLYLQDDYIKKAMDLYKYISIYFPQTESARHATDILFNIFYNLFENNQQTNDNLSDISRLAIFYDFIELTPSEYKGNKIINNVVDKLVALQLYDKAINLLTIQLNYKIKDKNLAQQIGERLADLYIKTQQYENAAKVLDITQLQKNPDKYTDNAKIIYAKVLLYKKQKEQAIDILSQQIEKIESKYTLAQVYWHDNNYSKIIETLEPTFLGKKVNLDEEGVINLTYLLVSYAINKDATKIKTIQDLYLTQLKQVDLEHKIDFLLRLAGDQSKDYSSEDKKLLDVWQNVLNIDSKVKNFMQDYDSESDFRKALKDRDYDKLLAKYADRIK